MAHNGNLPDITLKYISKERTNFGENRQNETEDANENSKHEPEPTRKQKKRRRTEMSEGISLLERELRRAATEK